MIMNTVTKSLTERPMWKALGGHYEEIRNLHLRKLFADDPSAVST
jgi:glucose-6-phosphate isomerase